MPSTTSGVLTAIPCREASISSAVSRSDSKERLSMRLIIPIARVGPCAVDVAVGPVDPVRAVADLRDDPRRRARQIGEPRLVDPPVDELGRHAGRDGDLGLRELDHAVPPPVLLDAAPPVPPVPPFPELEALELDEDALPLSSSP